MFLEMYKRALDELRKRPLRLWGLSLLTILIQILAVILTLGFLPLGTAFSYVVGCGMVKIYLDSLEGRSVNTDQLFDGFKTGKSFFHIAGGMAWQKLWSVIWSLVSIGAVVVGVILSVIASVAVLHRSDYYYHATRSTIGGGLIVLWIIVAILGLIPAIVKSYEYRFVPYILMTRPDINATAALRYSKRLTRGKKGQMFLADVVLGVGYFVVILVLSVFSSLPFIGGLFGALGVIVQILYMLFSPIFTGLYSAAFYLAPVPVKPVSYIPQTPNEDNHDSTMPM